MYNKIFWLFFSWDIVILLFTSCLPPPTSASFHSYINSPHSVHVQTISAFLALSPETSNVFSCPSDVLITSILVTTREKLNEIIIRTQVWDNSTLHPKITQYKHQQLCTCCSRAVFGARQGSVPQPWRQHLLKNSLLQSINRWCGFIQHNTGIQSN